MVLRGNGQLSPGDCKQIRRTTNSLNHLLLRRCGCSVGGGSHSYSVYVMISSYQAQSTRRKRSLPHHLGPFELTKLSAQISVLLANNKGSMTEPTERPNMNNPPQYGTLKTAMNLVKQKGFLGLYSGFNVHLRKCYTASASRGEFCINTVPCSAGHYWHCNLLYELRELQAASGQRAWQLSNLTRRCCSRWWGLRIGQLDYCRLCAFSRTTFGTLNQSMSRRYIRLTKPRASTSAIV